MRAPAPKSRVRPAGTGPEEYELHRSKALSLLERRFPRFSDDERLELYPYSPCSSP